MRTELLAKPQSQAALRLAGMSIHSLTAMYRSLVVAAESSNIATADEIADMFFNMRHINRWTIAETLGWLQESLAASYKQSKITQGDTK